jgi:hypothetical protein
MTGERRHGSWWQKWQDGNDRPGIASAFEGRFVRYFEASDVTYPPDAVQELGLAMTADREGTPTPEGSPDAEENRGVEGRPGIPAAFTYFGQFIDHDLTLDPTSNLHGRPLTEDELTQLVNFRTPRLDLDCLYGRGPSDQPYLYERDGLHLVEGMPMTGNPHDRKSVDIQRAPNGRALIGDPRNDENRIVAQLQSMMVRFHNKMADRAQRLAKQSGHEATLADVQNQVRWHYQWAIVHDFLPTIVQADVLAEVFPGRTDDPATTDDQPTFRVPYLRERHTNPPAGEPLLALMPVEFSVAAYRFGHSMIRPIYRLNQTIERRQIFASSSDPAGDLGGMRPIPSDWALDWQYFLDVEHRGHAAGGTHNGNDPLPRTPQYSYKIDTSLVNPLAHLSKIIADNPRSLPERNLLRGVAFSLPTGEQVAQAMGLTPLTPAEILIGKATKDPADPHASIDTIGSGAFTGRTPLWTYVLAEAWATSWAARGDIVDLDDVPVRLGPVGGHLVAETLAAFLVSDPNSYLYQHEFGPDAQLRHGNGFGLAEIVNTALGR